MKLQLSNRLMTCCTFVHPGDRVADVGCDHGYLGIYLLNNGIASRIIASDVNEGPLHSAVLNAEKFGCRDRMSFFLSNGVRSIPHDFDTMVCAGMGADTIISILEDAPWLRNPQYRLILQCQSKRPELRKYLTSVGFSISQETLAQDGKFYYTVMEVLYSPSRAPAPWEYYITPQLIADHSPLLPAFLARVTCGLEESAKGLFREGGTAYEERCLILEHLHQLERTLCDDDCK